MAVVNNAPVEANYTNSKLMSRTQDTSTTGKVALQNADVVSGAAITNTQRALNELFDAVGMTGEADPGRNNYSSNEVVADGDDRKEAIQKLDAEFNSTTGHGHSGVAGDGGLISAASLSQFNKFFAEFQSFTLASASGTSIDVSTSFVGKSASGGPSTLGVITQAPLNKVFIVNDLTNTFIEDAGGQRVYGRLTFSSPTWTLSFYTNEAGVETAHSLASQNINVVFREVFNQETRPTIPSNPIEFGTLDVTGDVVDASATQRGLVSTGSQVFGGNKAFQGSVELQSELYLSNENNNQSGAGVTLSLPAKGFVRLINGGLTSIAGITAPAKSQFVVIRNLTGAAVTITNSDTGATSVLTGTGADFVLQDDATAILVYDLASSRWTLIGGGGSGGGTGFGEQPAGLVNGVNATFGPLTYFPSDDDSMLVFVDGIQRPKSHYSVVGTVSKSIVFGSGHIPQLDQDVYVWYLKQGAAIVPPAPTGAWSVEYRTLTAGEITAKSLTLAGSPASPSGTLLDLIGSCAQIYSVDFTVSGSTLSWSGLGLDGVLGAGDVLRIVYIT